MMVSKMFILPMGCRDFVNGDLKDRFKKILKDGENSISEFELWENEKPYQLKNMVYKNLGNLKFKDVSQSWNLDHLGVSTGLQLEI